MKTSIVLLLLASAGFALEQTNVFTFTNRDGTVYHKVQIIRADKDGLVWRSAEGMGKTKFPDLPGEIQKAYGYDAAEIAKKEEEQRLETAKRQLERDKEDAKQELERAIIGGLFRELDGVVYDLRKSQPEWHHFTNAKLIQQLDDGVLINTTPDRYSLEVIHVKNLTVLSDTERVDFWAKLLGSYSYINKAERERVVRSYDAGRRCSRNEIPEVILAGGQPSGKSQSPSAPRISSVMPGKGSEEVQASGTGFFITEDGYLVTNDHVVHGAKKVKVRTRSGTLPADVVKTSRAFDLAVLKVTGRFKALQLDFDRGGRLGDGVFTIGFPNMDLQGVEPKYTDGTISSLSGIQDEPSQYQVSVPVQPGNSGGPLIANNGHVVGIVRAKMNDLTALASSGSIPQNVNYAVKAKYLRDLLEAIPGLMDKIRTPSKAMPKDDAIKLAQEAAVLMLVY